MSPAAVRKMRDTPITGPGASAARTRLYAALWAAAPAVAALYDQLWDQPPPQRTRAQRIAAAAVRRAARARGWPPPLGWDDGTGLHGIDNPAACPAPGWRPDGTHGRPAAALAEDAAELACQGYTRAQAADRLGVTRSALDQAFRRARQHAASPQAAHHTEPSLSPGEGA